MADSTTSVKSTKEILEIFSDPDLVSHGYIDTALDKFNPLTQQAELHSATSQLLSELDHASQELTWELEETMNVLRKSGPRLSYEVELLRSGVAGLATDLEEVSKDDTMKKSKNQDDKNMEKLEQLETVRLKMKEVEAVFLEAQKFNPTEEERKIVLLIDNGDIEGAIKSVERLSELIQIWKGTSIYSTRLKFVGELRKRIEDTLSQTEQNKAQQLRNNTSLSKDSKPDQSENDGYYGLLGQLRGRIGY